MSVHSYFRRIRAAFSAGGLNLVLFKIEDKIFKSNYCSDYLYKVFETATPEEYPKLVQDCVVMRTGRTFDIYNPRTFNEKIQWIKVFDSTPLKTRLADKYLVREWITEKIGAEYLVPLLGVWDRFDDIDFDTLPNQFALKCNHGSGWNIIVEDKSKLDMKDVRYKLESWMKKTLLLNMVNFSIRIFPRKSLPKNIWIAQTELRTTGSIALMENLCKYGLISTVEHLIISEAFSI